MEYKINGCTSKIYNSDTDVFDYIVGYIRDLPDNTSIYIWPDIIGRHILKKLNQLDKHINIYITGSIVNFLFSSYLQELITNQKIKIIDKSPESVDLAIINTRPHYISTGLVSLHEKIVPIDIGEVLEEIGANLGAKHRGVDTPYQLQPILLDDLIAKSKEFFFVFAGDLYKDVCSLVLEKHQNNSCISGTLLSHVLSKGKKVQALMDILASQQLELIRMPWYQDEFEWDQRSVTMALVQASLNLKKPIIELTVNDLQTSIRATMSEEVLLEYKGKVYDVLKAKIQLVSNGLPFLQNARHGRPLRVILFSPHPDDDVISAGGGCLTMAQSDNIEFHVAYCVTGACAVSDETVANIIKEYNVRVDESQQQQNVELSDSLITYMSNGSTDYKTQTNGISEETTKRQFITHDTLTKEIAQVLFGSGVTPKSKAFVREIEAQSGLDRLGFFKKPCNQAHFLRLPFYGSGYGVRTIYKEEDVNWVVKLIQDVKPDVMFLAGDLSDPHGTHGHCYNAIKDAFAKVEYDHIQQLTVDEYIQCQSLYSLTAGNCNLSLDEAVKVCSDKNITYKVMYRGAWADFEPYDTQFFIALDKDQIEVKRQAIRQHKSQMGAALYLGHNSQPFDTRAIERNTSNASNVKTLGILDSTTSSACVGIECYLGCGVLP